MIATVQRPQPPSVASPAAPDRLSLSAFYGKLVSALAADEGALLQRCVDALFEGLPCGACRIWTLEQEALRLRAAAGVEAPFLDRESDEALWDTEIGRIAREGAPTVTNDLRAAAPEEIQPWLAAEGIVAFAGYPVRRGEDTLGVVALFARGPFDDDALRAIDNATRLAAVGLDSLAARRRLHDSREVAGALLRETGQAIVQWSADGRILGFNGAAERLFGWTEGEARGRPLAMVPDERREEFQNALKRVFSGRRAGSAETLRRRSDGSALEVSTAMAPLYDGDGAVDRALEVVADLSQRKWLERLLRAQSEVTRVLVTCRDVDEAAGHLTRVICQSCGWQAGELWAADPEKGDLRLRGRWQSEENGRRRVPPGASLAGADFPGRVLTEKRPIWAPRLAHQESLPEACRQAALGLPIRAGERALGAMVFLDSHTSRPRGRALEALAGVADQVAGFLVRTRAEENLKATEAHLRQAQKLDSLGLLTGGVAHDFNNLLAVIVAYSELGRDELSDDHPLREMFCEIHDAAQRAAGLTRQLLAFTRKTVPRPAELDLNGVVENMQKMLRRLIGEDIHLESNLTPGLGLVKADTAQMEQVLLNLAVNARDAMPEGGSLKFETANVVLRKSGLKHCPQASPGPYVALSVTDTGCGMDQETLARIFEPFFTTKGTGRGAGLGLATVHGIVRQAGGHIAVRSEVGLGTSFVVYLPRINELPATRLVQAQPTESPTGSETVMLVEDEDVLRHVLRRVLNARGFSVLEARNGPEALEIADEHAGDVDLLLTESVMPGMRGKELAERLRRRRPRTKVVLMSGFADDRLCEDADALDAAFVQKPFTSDAILRKLRETLDAA